MFNQFLDGVIDPLPIVIDIVAAIEKTVTSIVSVQVNVTQVAVDLETLSDDVSVIYTVSIDQPGLIL